jgi:hypothetical protein
MTLTKASSEPILRISRESCLKSKQKQAVTSSRRRGVKFLLAKELKMNLPATPTREDTLQSMNTQRRLCKRRGSKSSSMLMMDLAALSEVSVECVEGSTHNTESIHQQEDRRNGLVGMREFNESFSSLATYDATDSRTTDHFLHA